MSCPDQKIHREDEAPDTTWYVPVIPVGETSEGKVDVYDLSHFRIPYGYYQTIGLKYPNLEMASSRELFFTSIIVVIERDVVKKVLAKKGKGFEEVEKNNED